MRARYQRGSVQLDNRTKVWYFRWRDCGQRRARRLGTLVELPTKAKANRVADGIRLQLNTEVEKTSALTINAVTQRYIEEKMPSRFSTSRAYSVWLNNYIMPRWGDVPIADLKPYDVELWLKSLLSKKGKTLAPKSKVHIRGLIANLLDCAMLWGYLPVGRNPMELITIKNAGKRLKRSRVLRPEEFRTLLENQKVEPYRTMMIIAMSLGLRVSELLALKWSDVDWLDQSLMVQRAIVRNRVDAVKTEYSERPGPLDPAILQVLSEWRRQTEFNKSDDWIWASPAQAGELPLSYAVVLRHLNWAAKKAGLGHLGTHSFRHSFRSWLDANGTPITVQQTLMRHADIRTTMRYGETLTEPMREAHSKVVRMVLPAAIGL